VTALHNHIRLVCWSVVLAMPLECDTSFLTKELLEVINLSLPHAPCLQSKDANPLQALEGREHRLVSSTT